MLNCAAWAAATIRLLQVMLGDADQEKVSQTVKYEKACATVHQINTHI
jgi:hypothetical protein